MAEAKVPVCRLCLEIIYDNNFEPLRNALTQLQFLLPKLNHNLPNNPVMCHKCKETIQKSVNFKTACLQTEGLVEQEQSKGIVCRICLKLIEGNLYTQLTVQEQPLLDKYFPEMNFNLTQNPFLCGLCMEGLQNHLRFVKSCLDVEDRIKNYFNASYVNINHSLHDMLVSSVKIEADSETDKDLFSNFLNKTITANRELPRYESHSITFVKTEEDKDNCDDTYNGLISVKKELPHDDGEEMTIPVKHEEVFIKEESSDSLGGFGEDYTNGMIDVETCNTPFAPPHLIEHNYTRFRYILRKPLLEVLLRYKDRKDIKIKERYRNIPKYRTKLLTKKIIAAKKYVRRLQKKIKLHEKMVEDKLKELHVLELILKDFARRTRKLKIGSNGVGGKNITKAVPENAPNPVVVPGPSRTQLHRKPISKEEKQIVLNVYNALNRTHPPTEALDKCSYYTGIPVAKIRRLVRGPEISGSACTPKTHAHKVVELNDEQKQAIRRTVYSLYSDNKVPTVPLVRGKLQDNKSIPGITREAIRKVLKNFHFRYVKQSRKSILLEKPKIISWRREYLRSIMTFRDDSRKIYYLGETTVHTTNHTEASGRKGQRLIVTHVGSVTGFINGSTFAFVSKRTGDHNEDMNAQRFERWFETVLENVEENSAIVMDDAYYHRVRVLDEIPTIANKKQHIQWWLWDKKIPFLDHMIKTELITLVRQNQPSDFGCAVKSLRRGVTVFRLPPYHTEFNPADLIWTQVRNRIERENITFKIADVQRLLQVALGEIQPEDWQSAIGHVLEVEREMWQMDEKVDVILDSFVMYGDSQDLSESDSSDESADSDD